MRKSTNPIPALSLAIALLGACTTSPERQDSNTILKAGDELARLYHEWPGSAERDREQTIGMLSVAYGHPLNDRVKVLHRERDAFQREEAAISIFRDYVSTVRPVPDRKRVIVMAALLVAPYDHNSKRFTVCWDSYSLPCSGASSLDLRTGAYVLEIRLPSTESFAFSPSEEVARAVEREASQLPSRRMRAFIEVEVEGTSFRDLGPGLPPQYVINGIATGATLFNGIPSIGNALALKSMLAAPRLAQISFR